MWNVFGNGMFAANGGYTDVRGLASLGEGIIARVKIFALLNDD
jgi:hypothetical protein